MKSAKDAPTASRLLDSDGPMTSDHSDDWGSQPICESCHWSVLATRRFRGRMLCLSCIAEYFDAEGEAGEDR